ncbi:hypothetical protein OG301_13960 [Streptomyces platensis]|uniref:hypothetical protein n=1 Tax=Streptomyces platensis TaxID=58346 RepID=UPI002ED1C087|nr:hypothetical protein OG301_13960 [Streptomyces platensis]
MNPMDDARLLPWLSAEGNPCFLVGDGTGYVARLADAMEEEQLDSAGELIEEALRLLAGLSWTPGELHLLAVELTTALTDVRRVAKGRGVRLAALGTDAPDGGDGDDGDDDGSQRPAEAFG